ncbi:MAG TPA: hypothetical protein VFV70_14130 [Hyphomonadaceae bacterium]|nr:hypothetical protein [Hyphomonadaceae bacterium]
MVNRLGSAILHRPGEFTRGFWGTKKLFKTERFTVDFVVDGTPLYSLIKDGDLCGVLMTKREKDFRNHFNQEVGTRFRSVEGEHRRIVLYTCPECWDPWCGAVACDLAHAEGHVTWSRFAYECGYIDEATPDFSSYENVGPFKFAAGQYADAIERAVRGETD